MRVNLPSRKRLFVSRDTNPKFYCDRSNAPNFQSSTMASSASLLTVIALITFTALFLPLINGSAATIPEPKAPNFQYFERPKYRYPYYDENGRGKLLYGYGGPELYQYKVYSALEGIH
ncbi:uncharacterized protein LOC116841480 [Odontomachus brunneus]|uniref:uncharacterized protein LOC116841480 n=1 Tax=Odontomachus brunneus TaxID=486640 RepID=UPI0013F21F8C|nr:uncharacterized protein LOC116841480 [Odontomachus brunneus]